MNWISAMALALEIFLLLYAAFTDVARRLIYNEICLLLAMLGIAGQALGHAHVIESLAAASILFLMLLVAYVRGWMGGGDVKLLVAVAVGLPLAGVVQLLAVTAYAGGGLAMAHLMLRRLPRATPAPRGSSFVRRVYSIERWRNVRGAPLPFGAAIACGGIWTLFRGGF